MQRGSKWNRIADHWLGIAVVNGVALLRGRRHVPENIRNIGVMCSPALGDTLLFSAVLQDIRAAYRSAQIVHFCMKSNFAAAEIISGADKRIVIDLTRPLSAVRQVRAAQVDVLFDFTSWQRLTAFLTLMAGARYTVGFRTAGQYRGRAYDFAVDHSNECHEIENFRRLLRTSGLATACADQHQPAVSVPIVANLPFAEESELIALHPWASGQRSWLREWPEERWVDLACRLRASTKHPSLFLVTGGPADRPRIAVFVERLRAAGLRADSFVSPDGLVTLTHVLRRCRLLISVNTGVMHLAAVANAAVVGLSGPTSNLRWGPYGPYAAGIQAPGPDCGYLNLGFEFDGQATDCMERISVDQVYAAAQQLLSQTGAA